MQCLNASLGGLFIPMQIELNLMPLNQMRAKQTHLKQTNLTMMQLKNSRDRHDCDTDLAVVLAKSHTVNQYGNAWLAYNACKHSNQVCTFKNLR